MQGSFVSFPTKMTFSCWYFNHRSSFRSRNNDFFRVLFVRKFGDETLTNFFICSWLFWPNLLRARLLRRRRLRLSKGLARGQLRSAWSRSSTMPSGLFRPRRLWSRHPEVRLQGTVDWTWLLQRSVHRTLTIVSPIVRSLNKPCLEPSALIAANT